jgi:hypothetical protein
MTNLQLFLWKSQKMQDNYPSAFQLIRIAPKIDPPELTLQQLMSPAFPVLSYKVRELVDISCLRLQGNSFASRVEPLHDLFTVIAQHYSSVSYHHFSHAFTLMLVKNS